MKSILFLAAVVLATAPAFAQGTAAQPTQDIVKLRNNTEVKGKISKMTSTQVMIKDSSNKEVPIKREDIIEVVLGDKSTMLKRADGAFAEMNYDKAGNLYTAALEELGKNMMRDLHKQFIYMSQSAIAKSKNDIDGALALLKRIRTECGDCWLRQDSYRKSLEYARRREKDSDAAVQEVLGEMKNEPDPMGGEADLELAKMKYTKGDFDGANSIFTALSGKGASYSADAKLWSIRCLRAQKKLDELDGICQKILADKGNSSMALIQTAGATLGQSLLKKAEKDETRLRDATMAFAQAIAVGPPQNPKEDGEDHAVALIGIAKCYTLMSNVAKTESGKTECKERAKDYLREAQRTYRGTEWEGAAKRELAALEASAPPPPPPK